MNSADQINPAEQVERIREILIGRDMNRVHDRIHQLESKVQAQSSDISRVVSDQLSKAEHQYRASQENIQTITQHIRTQLQQETITRGQQINDLAQKIDDAASRMDKTTQQLLNVKTGDSQDLSQKIENLSSEMAARIDAHSRQIMEHMHREIQQWKNRMDGQISQLAEGKLDRQELTTRLARIASAAMGDAVPPAISPTPSTPTSTASFGGSSTPNITAHPDIPSASVPTDGPSTPTQDTPSTPNLSSLDVFTIPNNDFTS